MKTSTSAASLLVGALFIGLSTLSAPAQEAQPAPKPPAVATANATTNSAPAKPATAAVAQSEIADVLKMLDAGVSKDVVKAYIENSPTVYNLTPTDVIALKERGANDDITMVLLKRSADVRAQAAQVAAAAPAPQPEVNASPRTVRYFNSANLNPESEEYFQYYYFYPRTLANVYQTLGAQPVPYYGYYPSMTYGPGFRPGYGPVRRGYRR